MKSFEHSISSDPSLSPRSVPPMHEQERELDKEFKNQEYVATPSLGKSKDYLEALNNGDSACESLLEDNTQILKSFVTNYRYNED